MERDVEKGCSEKEIEKEQDKKNISLKLYIGRRAGEGVKEKQREGESPLLTPMYWPDRVWYYRAPRGAVLLKISSSRRRSPKVI